MKLLGSWQAAVFWGWKNFHVTNDLSLQMQPHSKGHAINNRITRITIKFSLNLVIFHLICCFICFFRRASWEDTAAMSARWTDLWSCWQQKANWAYSIKTTSVDLFMSAYLPHSKKHTIFLGFALFALPVCTCTSLKAWWITVYMLHVWT